MLPEIFYEEHGNRWFARDNNKIGYFMLPALGFPLAGRKSADRYMRYRRMLDYEAKGYVFCEGVSIKSPGEEWQGTATEAREKGMRVVCCPLVTVYIDPKFRDLSRKAQPYADIVYQDKGETFPSEQLMARVALAIECGGMKHGISITTNAAAWQSEIHQRNEDGTRTSAVLDEEIARELHYVMAHTRSGSPIVSDDPIVDDPE